MPQYLPSIYDEPPSPCGLGKQGFLERPGFEAGGLAWSQLCLKVSPLPPVFATEPWPGAQHEDKCISLPFA